VKRAAPVNPVLAARLARREEDRRSEHQRAQQRINDKYGAPAKVA
jgi:hypothetical protein